MSCIKIEKKCLEEQVLIMQDGLWKKSLVILAALMMLDMSICSASMIQLGSSSSGKTMTFETEAMSIGLFAEEDTEVSLLTSHILSNRASLPVIKASEIAKVILEVSAKYKVPAFLVSAIANVESSYRLNAVNKGSSDYGIMQVNAWNVRKLKLDKARLLTDLKYSVDAGVSILAWFVKKYPLDEAIMRYNCGTRPSCVRLPQVKRYLRKVKGSM